MEIFSYLRSLSEVSHQTAEMRPTDIIVSALYFIIVLLLIYAILALVSRWGKKHPEEKTDNDKEENAEAEAQPSAPKTEEAKGEARLSAPKTEGEKEKAHSGAPEKEEEKEGNE